MNHNKNNKRFINWDTVFTNFLSLRIYEFFAKLNLFNYCTNTVINFRGKIRSFVVIEFVVIEFVKLQLRALLECGFYSREGLIWRNTVSDFKSSHRKILIRGLFRIFRIYRNFASIEYLLLQVCGWPQQVGQKLWGKLQKVVYHPSQRQRTHDTYIPNYLQPKF